MKRLITAAKETRRGVFWIVDDELLAFPFVEDDYTEGIAKAGNTYNHERLWPYVKPKGCKHNFKYYPRGRVDIDNKGRAVIYMNPNISENFIPRIKTEFGLRDDPTLIYDHSEHYKCHLDK